MKRVARHKLVWLSEAGWQALAVSRSQDEAQLVAQWARRQWPAVARRRDADAADSEICLGIPAPPDPASGLKRRFGFRVPADAVARVTAPPRLHDLIGILPEPWQQPLCQLCVQADGIELRAYGSAALAHLTGLPYLTAQSDIDLLWKPASRAELARGLELLAAFASLLPLDGEIEFPGEQSVAWKEWLQVCKSPGNRVLVKDARQVRLARVDDLVAALEIA